MYSYRMLGRDEENPNDRRLLESAKEAGSICLQLAVEPAAYFITESRSQGYIHWPQRIDGYTNCHGNEIFINHGLEPKILVQTVLHECRHCFQRHTPKLNKLGRDFKERDARFYSSYEFWGSHSNNGDAATLMRTLEKIADEVSESLWKEAKAKARARLSTKCTSNVHSPARPETESSDALRRQFEPVLQARSLEIQKLVDPDNSRRLFPAGIEFSYPRSTLTVSYQNKKEIYR